jgi:UDP-galactopyranose mutase
MRRGIFSPASANVTLVGAPSIWEDEPRDERWVPLRQLLARVARRYGRPVILAETSHFGSGRARWIREIGHEVAAAREAAVPVEGVCLYPAVDRPDWEDALHWHNSGLWDVRRTTTGVLERVINVEYAEAFQEARAMVAPTL